MYTYQYLSGTRPEDSSFAVQGDYENLRRYLSSIQQDESEREEFAKQLHRDAIIEALSEYSDLRFECHVMRNGQLEWEHMNIICLERTDGKASKVLIIRQNITEVKEKELRIQAEMALADRKERQYRIAITSNAFCTYEFRLRQAILIIRIRYATACRKCFLPAIIC